MKLIQFTGTELFETELGSMTKTFVKFAVTQNLRYGN